MQDAYYAQKEISNSDLSELNKYFSPASKNMDVEAAYRFGRLIDVMITEPHKADHLNCRIDGEQFNQDEWWRAKKMFNSFRSDELCSLYLRMSDGQVSLNKEMIFDYCGFNFSLPVRCKYDLYNSKSNFGADIKSTTATTQNEFLAAIKYFDYDRQRAFYMDISGADTDMLIGISKVNFKIFKLPIKRGDATYNSGKEKYTELAFRWWYLFSDLNKIVAS